MSDSSFFDSSDLDDIAEYEMIMEINNEDQDEVEAVRMRRYINRERDVAEERLMADYFGPHPKYPAEYFRRRYRMKPRIFWKSFKEAIKTRNLGADCVKEARLQTLITEFENLKMLDNGTIDEYAAKLSGIASKLATLGEVMSEYKLVKKFLSSLPRRFVHIMAALEQVLDLKTTGFEDVVGRLTAYEERVKEEDIANDAQENFLYARTEYSNGNNDSSGGRGRGSYS
ncbi:hypothetical protein Tco_0674939 [Tanacetum coccineum]